MKNNFTIQDLIKNIERRNILSKKLKWEYKEIKIKNNFLNFLEKIDSENSLETTKKTILKKIFTILNQTAELTKNNDTWIITSMYDYSGMRFLDKLPEKRELKEFIKYIKEKNISFSSITSMQNKKWFPNLEDLKNIIEICEKYEVSFSSVSGMQHSKWIPNTRKFIELLEFCKQENIDFESITSMQHWKGIPNLIQLKNFINLCKKANINIKDISREQLWVQKSIEKLKAIL